MHETGLNDAVTPAGSAVKSGPETFITDKATDAAVPPVLVTVTVLVPLDPLETVRVPLFESVYAKDCPTVSVKLVERPTDPCTYIV